MPPNEILSLIINVKYKKSVLEKGNLVYRNEFRGF